MNGLAEIIDVPANLQAPVEGTESTINSTDAIDMISHGSEIVISIVTPIGMKYLGKTKFIGFHSNYLILIEAPEMSEEKFESFFQEGFRMNVRALSQKGEGATINFRCQIIHILTKPIRLVMISVPGMMTVNQLRKEARYDVNLKGRVHLNGIKMECEIRDLSKSGCRFITGSLSKYFELGQQVSIEVVTDKKTGITLQPLEGTVCNLQSSLHYTKYGFKFDDVGQKNAKALMACLKFNGTKLTLK